MDLDASVSVLMDRTDRILKILEGNGRPGLVAELSAAKQEMVGLRADVDRIEVELRERTPSRKEKATLITSAAAGAIALMGWLVTEILPHVKVTDLAP